MAVEFTGVTKASKIAPPCNHRRITHNRESGACYTLEGCNIAPQGCQLQSSGVKKALNTRHKGTLQRLQGPATFKPSKRALKGPDAYGL